METKHYCQKFESAIDFANWLNSRKNSRGWSKTHSKDNDWDFTGTLDYNEADSFMLSGWESGTAKVAAIMHARGAECEEVRKITLGYVGALCCVPAALAGSPRYMLSVKKKKVAKPVIRLLYCTGTPQYITTDQILDAGATMFNTILGLEAGGVRVELWAGTVASSCGEYIANFVKIKSADQPINIMQMTYPVIHPSFHRRHSFAFREKCGAKSKNWHGYGLTVTNESDIRECAAAAGLLNIDSILTFDKVCCRKEKQIAEYINGKK